MQPVSLFDDDSEIIYQNDIDQDGSERGSVDCDDDGGTGIGIGAGIGIGTDDDGGTSGDVDAEGYDVYDGRRGRDGLIIEGGASLNEEGEGIDGPGLDGETAGTGIGTGIGGLLEGLGGAIGGEGSAGKKWTKSERNFALMFDPDHSQNSKSLWKHYTNTLRLIPTLESEASGPGAKGLGVEGLGSNPAAERSISIEDGIQWYCKVLTAQRKFLQTSFEEPQEMAALARRVSTHMKVKQPVKHDWRQRWIMKHLELEAQLAAENPPSGAGVEKGDGVEAGSEVGRVVAEKAEFYPTEDDVSVPVQVDEDEAANRRREALQKREAARQKRERENQAREKAARAEGAGNEGTFEATVKIADK